MKPYYNSTTKTLYLKRLETSPFIKEKDVNIYLTAVSEEELSEISKYKSLKDEDLKLNMRAKYPHIILQNIILLGDANKKRLSMLKLENFLDKIVKQERLRSAFSLDIKLFYRNYERPEEEWKNLLAYVNTCGDATMGWQSAIRKLGAKGVKGINNTYKPFYVVLWYDQTPMLDIQGKWNL